MKVSSHGKGIKMTLKIKNNTGVTRKKYKGGKHVKESLKEEEKHGDEAAGRPSRGNDATSPSTDKRRGSCGLGRGRGVVEVVVAV